MMALLIQSAQDPVFHGLLMLEMDTRFIELLSPYNTHDNGIKTFTEIKGMCLF